MNRMVETKLQNQTIILICTSVALNLYLKDTYVYDRAF